MVARNGSGNVDKLAVIFLEGLRWLEFFSVGYFFVEDLIIAPHLKTGKRSLFSENKSWLGITGRFTMFGMAVGLIGDDAFGLDETDEVALLGFGLLKDSQPLFSVFKIPNIRSHFLLLIVPLIVKFFFYQLDKQLEKK